MKIDVLGSKIIQFLHPLSSAIHNAETVDWFYVNMFGIMSRLDHLGVSSVLRVLNIDPSRYNSCLHFYRSESWSAEGISNAWLRVLKDKVTIVKIAGRYVTIGDGSYLEKSGYFMPGMGKHGKSTGNTPGQSYICGELFGAISILCQGDDGYYSVPVSAGMQMGLAPLADWDPTQSRRSLSHVQQMALNGCDIAHIIGPSILVLDRLFLTSPLLDIVEKANYGGQDLLHVVTRAKRNVVAYEDLCDEDRFGTDGKPLPGRPRKFGETVKPFEYFKSDTVRNCFQSVEVTLYGRKEKVQYMIKDLNWGPDSKHLYKLRFVMVKTSRGNVVLVSTDLTLSAKEIIELYGARFKIEGNFKAMKSHIGADKYHFWCKGLDMFDPFMESDEPTPLEQVDSEDKGLQQRIISCVEATERFFLLGAIVAGILEILAHDKEVRDSDGDHNEHRFYMRTPAVSVWYLRYVLMVKGLGVFGEDPQNPITRAVRKFRQPSGSNPRAYRRKGACSAASRKAS